MPAKRRDDTESNIDDVKKKTLAAMAAGERVNFVKCFGANLRKNSRVFVGRAGEIALVVGNTRFGKLIVGTPITDEEIAHFTAEFESFLKDVNAAFLEKKLREYADRVTKLNARKQEEVAA